MSRIISEVASTALMHGRNFKQSNTRVEDGALYLHDNKIAELRNGVLWINLCGWVTLTTCERLNALPGVHLRRDHDRVFLNGQEIDSKSWVRI